MEITFLGVVFAVIIVLLAIGRPLYQAIAGGMVVTAVLFHIPVTIIGTKIVSVITNWSSLSVLLSLYLITFLQKILESRSQIRLAQQDLNGIFHNRRINTAGAAFFIGLLPSAASMILCADIVKDATEGYLDPKRAGFYSQLVQAHTGKCAAYLYSSTSYVKSFWSGNIRIYCIYDRTSHCTGRTGICGLSAPHPQ